MADLTEAGLYRVEQAGRSSHSPSTHYSRVSPSAAIVRYLLSGSHPSCPSEDEHFYAVSSGRSASSKFCALISETTAPSVEHVLCPAHALASTSASGGLPQTRGHGQKHY